ncbi:MAG: hypothetical protein QME87_00010 [Bacillota bacterium]|nr:hypothetical protein [Bacillota bacterium]
MAMWLCPSLSGWLPDPEQVVGWLGASRVGMACGTVAETSISLSGAANLTCGAGG